MAELPRFKTIVQESGRQVSPEVRDRILGFITARTFLIGSAIGVPPQTDGRFMQRPRDAFGDFRELSNRVVDIFNLSGKKKSDSELFVLSEEDTGRPDDRGVTQFPLDIVTERVIPYIWEHEGLGNFWITDGNVNVVTLHHSGVVYWRR